MLSFAPEGAGEPPTLCRVQGAERPAASTEGRGTPHERKNFLFVGHDPAGENLAGLYSLVATCEANGVNPIAYLADVLLRVQTHPASRIDEILPHKLDTARS